jgi:hypothetical protein
MQKENGKDGSVEIKAIKHKLDVHDAKLEMLPDAEDFQKILESIEAVSEISRLKDMIKELANQLSELAKEMQLIQRAKTVVPVAQPATLPGRSPEVKGDYSVINELDPNLYVEIAMEKREGVMAKIMSYYTEKNELAEFAPKYDPEGYAHYLLPRHFAEANLRDTGGKKFFLCWPEKLTVHTRGSDLKRVETVMVSKLKPIMVQ